MAPPLHAVKATSSRPFKPGSVHHCPIVLVGLFFSQSCSPLLSSAIIVWLPTPFAATLAGCRSVAAPEGGPFVGTAFVELKRVPVPPPPSSNHSASLYLFEASLFRKRGSERRGKSRSVKMFRQAMPAVSPMCPELSPSHGPTRRAACSSLLSRHCFLSRYSPLVTHRETASLRGNAQTGQPVVGHAPSGHAHHDTPPS